MNTLELIQLLERLVCLPNSRYSAPFCGNSKVGITNGHIVFALHHSKCLSAWNDDADFMSKLESIIVANTKPVSITIPEIPVVPCWQEANQIIKGQCGECDGTGVVWCEYDHEHTCPECNGTGSTEKPAIEQWREPPDERYYRTEAGLFDKRYLWILSEIEKHRTVSYSVGKAGDGEMLCFEFEDGFGGLMSVLDRQSFKNRAA